MCIDLRWVSLEENVKVTEFVEENDGDDAVL